MVSLGEESSCCKHHGGKGYGRYFLHTLSVFTLGFQEDFVIPLSLTQGKQSLDMAVPVSTILIHSLLPSLPTKDPSWTKLFFFGFAHHIAPLSKIHISIFLFLPYYIR